MFPSPASPALPQKTLSEFMRALRVDAVPRGVCELALALVNRDRVEAACMRTDLFERRRTPAAGAVVQRVRMRFRTTSRVSSRPHAGRRS